MLCTRWLILNLFDELYGVSRDSIFKTNKNVEREEDKDSICLMFEITNQGGSPQRTKFAGITQNKVHAYDCY